MRACLIHTLAWELLCHHTLTPIDRFLLQGLPETVAVSVSEALALYNLTAVQVGDRRLCAHCGTSPQPQQNVSALLVQHAAFSMETVAQSTCWPGLIDAGLTVMKLIAPCMTGHAHPTPLPLCRRCFVNRRWIRRWSWHPDRTPSCCPSGAPPAGPTSSKTCRCVTPVCRFTAAAA